MTTEAKRRPGGARPNGPLLERDQIIDEATTLAGEVGLDGVSMRQLGERLDVTSMAIYWYVRNRGELVDAVADRVVSLIPIPSDSLPWDAWLRQISLDTHDVLAGYAGIADHVLSATETPPAIVERWTTSVGVLIEAGCPPEMARTSVSVLGTFVLARAQLNAHRRLADRPDPEGYPSDEVLRSGVDLIISGIPVPEG